MTIQAIDPETFAEIHSLMEDAMAEFVKTYLDNSPKLIANMVQGLADNDAEPIYQNAHQLKGGSGSIGALRLAELASEIEAICKEGGLEGVADLMNQLKTEFDEVEDELKALASHL